MYFQTFSRKPLKMIHFQFQFYYISNYCNASYQNSRDVLMSYSTTVPLDLVATFLNAIFVCLFLIVAHILECLGHFSISCNPCSFCIISTAYKSFVVQNSISFCRTHRGLLTTVTIWMKIYWPHPQIRCPKSKSMELRAL